MNGRLLGLIVASVALLAICIFFALGWARKMVMMYVRPERQGRIQHAAYDLV